MAALAGCGDLPRPFQPEAKAMPVVRPVSPEAAAILREPVAVAVQPVSQPAGRRRASAWRRRWRWRCATKASRPISIRAAPSYTLAGIANVRELPLELEIKVTWFLLDPKGFRMAQLDQITRGRVEDWMEGNDRLISRIAQNQAPPVAAMINLHTAQRGATTRGNPGSGPAAQWRGAAARQFLAAGQWRIAPATAGETHRAAPRAALRADASKPVSPATATAPAAPQQAAAAPAGKPQAVRIVVPRVDGRAGRWTRQPGRRHEARFGRRNFAIVPKADAGSLTVRGKVELKPFNNGREVITITWAVLDAQNNQVGEIEQSNVIPGGSLNGEWGPIAREITVAAAEGLLDLLDKASKAARQ